MNSTQRRQSATKIPIDDPSFTVNNTDMYNNNYYYQDPQTAANMDYYTGAPQDTSNTNYHQDPNVPAAKSAACIIL